MSIHFNDLSAAEQERLALLAEECGELVQAIGKVLRHGYNSVHPDTGENNRQAVERECGDVQYAVRELCRRGDLSDAAIDDRVVEKAKSVLPYLHHQGLLD